MSTHANPVVCPNSSSNTPVPSHPYGTRTKTKAFAQNLKMLSHNSLFDASSTIFKEVSEEKFSKLQPVKQEDDCSSNDSIPSSPRQNWCSKIGSGIMNVSELINPSQQKVSEMINPSELKELIKEAIKDKVERPPVAELKKVKDAHKGGNVLSEKGGSKQSMTVDAKPLKISKKKAQDAKVIPEYEVLTMAIKFGLFDPIILPVASTKLATSQQTRGSHFSETNENEDNEGWTLVTRHKAKKNHLKCVKVLETQKKAHQLISKPKQTLVQRKKTPSEFHKASQRHVKRPITLNEFMPSQLKEVKCHSPRKPEDGEAKPHILEKSDQKKKELSQPVKGVDEITKNLGNLTLPLTNLQKDEVTKPSLKGFVRPSKGPLVEHDELPSQRANCFDPNAYRLLVKAGYDHEDVTKMANETRTIWQKKVKPTKQGLVFHQ
ncbi:hypothetical protein COLO4_04800 [Corchorus olitorius]|uniref:Uncharacterized protein n=1 Tax=Corchorus olitorius TaxID=93759 RepID=A0A1R3KSQ1_9ROSI|nr:hypothetical protein COLO4_04800 [Corchorus olitorius]